MNKIEAIRNILESGMMDDSDIIEAWDSRCTDEGKDEFIYENDEEFFELHYNNDLLEMARAVSKGAYNLSDEYVWVNKLGNIESGNMSEVISEFVDFEGLAQYISETNYNSFEEVWSFDLFDSFMIFYRDKYNIKQSDETIEETFFKEDYNLVLDDWDVIGEALYKKLNQ